MAGFLCAFCKHTMPITDETRNKYDLIFNYVIGPSSSLIPSNYPEAVRITFYKCPNCLEVTIQLVGLGEKTNGIFIPVYPNSLAVRFPSYVPEPIRKDYEEACSIVNLSPKASATLSRRCLQGMIRDFWGITDSSLQKEIQSLKGNISTTLWDVIDGVRRIGNIGAHMEKDINLIVEIDPNEAITLIKLIELLIRSWYIERHEQQKLFSEILDIDVDKQIQRKPIE